MARPQNSNRVRTASAALCRARALLLLARLGGYGEKQRPGPDTSQRLLSQFLRSLPGCSRLRVASPARGPAQSSGGIPGLAAYAVPPRTRAKSNGTLPKATD